MTMLAYILWHPDLFAHIGPLSVRWYSLLWLIGLLAAYLYVGRIYRREGVAEGKFEPLFLYCFVGILAGARIGHCVFYQPDYFLATATGWFEMFVPVKITGTGGLWASLTSGAWRFTGYEGLASHGGTLGLTLAILAYCCKTKVKPLFVLDAVAVATPVTACCIRLGNLMNSEIIGRPTDVPWAFIFERVDMLPRHPGQLYEAMFYAALAVVMWWLYNAHTQTQAPLGGQGEALGRSLGSGFFFGLCITCIFAFRFVIEWTKEVQEAFEEGMPLNMGQILSLPFIALGLWFVWRATRRSEGRK